MQLPKDARGRDVKNMLQHILDAPESECKKTFTTIVDMQVYFMLMILLAETFSPFMIHSDPGKPGK